MRKTAWPEDLPLHEVVGVVKETSAMTAAGVSICRLRCRKKTTECEVLAHRGSLSTRHGAGAISTQGDQRVSEKPKATIGLTVKVGTHHH